MARPWDTWTIAFAGSVVGLVFGVGHILAARLDAISAAPVSLGALVLFVAGTAALFAIVSLMRNRVVARRP